MRSNQSSSGAVVGNGIESMLVMGKLELCV